MKQLTTKNTEIDKNYQNLLQEVKGILDKGLHTAYKAVDNIKVQTYWQVGERIVREELKYKDRAEYGKYLIGKLAEDLGFGKRLLHEIVKFYQVYRIVHALHSQLSWTHYRLLINIANDKKRSFYENKTIQSSWSYRDLHKQIKACLYENTAQQEIDKIFKIKPQAIETPEVFKDTYNFNFLQLETGDKEKILEDMIVKNIEPFLKELGDDFAFIGRQVPVKIDNKTHLIDLALYHKAIPCNILIDLKIGKISSGDIGQMNKYVNYFRQNKQYEHEKETIGLIIGREAGIEEMQYTLGGLEHKIFVAKYKGKLPSDDTIKKAMKKLS